MPSWSTRFLHTNAASPSGTAASSEPSLRERRESEGRVRHYDLTDHAAAFPTLHHPRNPPTPAKVSQQKNRQHGRSTSHPFPSLFGSSKKKSSGNLRGEPALESTDDDALTAALGGSSGNSPLRRNTGKKLDDKDVEIGNCMTCDSKVKWPKGLKVFRCAACLTINDLEPARQREPHTGERETLQTSGKSGTYPGTASQIQVLPLSVERTRATIDRCILSYLRSRCEPSTASPPKPQGVTREMPRGITQTMNPSEGKPRQNSGSRFDSPPPICLTPPASEDQDPFAVEGRHKMTFGPRLDSLPSRRSPASPAKQEQTGATGESIPARPTRKPPPPPVQVPNVTGVPPASRSAPLDGTWGSNAPKPGSSPRLTPEELQERRRYENIKAIFRPLEEYLIASFGNYECLNTSFSTARPPLVARARSEGAARVPRSDMRSEEPANLGGFMSEMDAKTLLLGDFAENGSWWTGRVERNKSHTVPSKRNPHDEHPMALVNSKSPCINWIELNRWYDAVLTAGTHWKDRLQGLHSDGSISSWADNLTAVDMEEVEEDIFEAGVHTQRALLKITENILKRPGRPLREPDDIRFLFILLYNPLLHPSSSRSFLSDLSRQMGRKDSQTLGGRPAALKPPGPRGSPMSRQASKSGRETGQHSGIIKRILGLLANLPNECHRYLIAWFSRFSEEQFRRTTDLVGSFVTYRITRQQEKRRNSNNNPAAGLIPEFTSSASTSAQLHAALGLSGPAKKTDDSKPSPMAYGDDWQLKAAAKVMSLLFTANNMYYARKTEPVNLAPSVAGLPSAGLAARQRARNHGQLLPTSDFYNTLLDYTDLVADFEAWEARRGQFSFCQYPFFLSIGAKIRIMEHDARRQMENKAREAFFDSILSNKQLDQYFHLRVRRDCLVDDSLRQISESVGAGGEEIKKGLKVHFLGEEGIDAGGLRKEWFLLLVRDLFDPNFGLFIYDEDSHFCYFNPHSFETSDQFFLVGAVLGLAIYNSTILDVALPPFAFKKLLASAPAQASTSASNRVPLTYTLEDLAEFRPALAHGLRQLLDFDGDVEATFCRDFVGEVERYGSITHVALCAGGETRPVTNANRHEFVELYVRYLLETSVARQFEPFKRGFFTVCGGNALSLFRPEEIELLVRGSDEPLDVASVRAVAVYDGWKDDGGRRVERPGESVAVVRWFWEFFEAANPQDQRKILSFVTGSDRIPAVGATNLVIKITCVGEDCERFPVARTCFNMLQLYKYGSRQELVQKLWRAVVESEGFGLK